MSGNDVVTFLLPDGTEVSNDPRWLAEEGRTAMEVAIDSVPNTGKEGSTEAEQSAMMGGGMSAPQSGQPGVGEHAVEEDPNAYGRAGVQSGMSLQLDDAAHAKEQGFSPASPGVEAPEPLDVNAAVQEVREKAAAEREAQVEAQNALSQEDRADLDTPYEEWTGKALTAEIKRRRASGREVPMDGRKKPDAIAALEADDEAQNA